MKNIIIYILIAAITILAIAYILKGKIIRITECTVTKQYEVWDEMGHLIYQSYSDSGYLDPRYTIKLIKK